ncbi:Efg1 protein [Saccharomycopsis crataegensis]|uniref:rRNA-processing protein EFG1 n=1 Tax=Saccharomycopsis crataegensis TaxID=43959 RepID=A0AAV5QE33_9ASCO|nr:Efg1 protein [Saccharomycopsis crataegensis]
MPKEDTNSKKKFNSKKQGNKKPNNKPSEEGSAKLKKAKRDLSRLLKKPDLPADIRTAKEQSLQAIELQLQALEHVRKTKELARRYHMVRFFEKKKAIRRYKQVKKEMEDLEKKTDKEGEDSNAMKKELKKQRKKLAQYELDVLYVVNFPKDQKYLALFPNEGAKKAITDEPKQEQAKTDKERLDMRKKIQNMANEGKLPVSLEDILSGNVDHEKLIQHQQQGFKLAEPDKIQKRKTKAQSAADDNNDEEDDFFE